MPRFAPVSEFLAEPLTLPARGRDGVERDYQITPVDAETGLRLTARFDKVRAKAKQAGEPDAEVADDEEELDLYRTALGDTYDQVLADGVPYPMLKHLAQTALAWHVFGERAAALLWSAGTDPKRSPSDSETSSTESSENPGTQAADPSTPSPGSANGTTPNRKRRKATARSGATSSTAGTS